MAYDDVLELPLKVFTLYNTNVNRLRAEEDIRTIRNMIVSGSTGAADVLENLKEEMGEPLITENEGVEYVPMEEGAFETLQGLASLR